MKFDAFWRFRAVQIGLLIMSLAILFQIIIVQNSLEGQEMVVEGEGRNGALKNISPDRGEIFDHNGTLLATNEPVYEIGVDLDKVYDDIGEDTRAREIAMTLQIMFDLDYNTVLTAINWEPGPDESPYVLLEKYAPYDEVQDFIVVRDAEQEKGSQTGLNLEAVYFVPHMIRSYPERFVAANILGMITLNDERTYGVEEFYDSLLSGSSERQWIPYSPSEAQKMPESPTSTTLILTIDRDIQYAVEQILDDGLDTYGAEAGVIVVADPQTGELLAMASSPRLDPNQYWDAQWLMTSTPFNKAVSDVYEPGSVLKILTMGAALDAGVVTPNDIYNDYTGVYDVGGFLVKNWDDAAWGPVTMTECLQHSLNVCLAYIAVERLKEDLFYDYMQAFGLGHMTGVDLADEVPGRLKLPTDTDYTKMELGINAFGQGVSVSPIQMIMASSAIANDGRMPRPHVLKATILDGVQHDMPIEIVGTPISKEASDTLTSMLVTSLENESSYALVDGYALAGKTGTASIMTENTPLTNASFIGWGPADDPQFIVYIWLEKPTESPWGSETAAPIFKQVVQKLVILMGIPPDQVRLGLTGH